MKNCLFGFTVTVSLLFFSQTSANKIDLMGGLFAVQAKTSTQEGSISNLGAYRMSYLLPAFTHFEIGLGYSLIMSGVVAGDLSYGLDFILNYFPFSPSRVVTMNSDTSNILWEADFRPYVVTSFHQRQFQSVKTSYAGFGIGGGFEKFLIYGISLKGELRYVLLQGAQSATANELTVVGGLSFIF